MKNPAFDLSQQLISILAILSTMVLSNQSVFIQESANGKGKVEIALRIASSTFRLVPFELHEGMVVQWPTLVNSGFF